MLDRINALRGGGFGLTVEQRDGPGDGWLAADALEGELDVLLVGIAELAGIDHPPLGAEWLLEHCAWQGASLAVAAALDGWVPDLSPANVLLWFRDGGVWGIALREVRSAGAGPRAAHDQLEALLRPVVAAITARRLRAERPLWRAAGDRVGQAVVWAGDAFGDPGRARRLGEAMLAPPSPMHVPLQTALSGDGVPFHVRSSCCLLHRVPGVEVCAGCPLRRSPRLRAAA
jgi:hypothetical protein